jgi:hypothetical protein
MPNYSMSRRMASFSMPICATSARLNHLDSRADLNISLYRIVMPQGGDPLRGVFVNPKRQAKKILHLPFVIETDLLELHTRLPYFCSSSFCKIITL